MDLILYNSSDLYTHTFNLPNLCKVYSSTGANTYQQVNYRKSSYLVKTYSYSTSPILTIYNNPDVSGQLYIQGTATVAEGVYYTSIKGTAEAFTQASSYVCPYSYYAYFYDKDGYESLRRF